jgi:SAM-dependent methyltransferase
MFKKLIAKQFRKPSGLLGHYAANFMKKNNQNRIVYVCDLVNPQDNDSILEIGCGAGYAIQLLSDKNSLCTIDAIDFSAMMIQKAKKINLKQINTNRVRLFRGNFSDYIFKNAYSKVFAINVIYFWKDLVSEFSKVYSILKEGGQLILYMSGPEHLRKIPFAVDEVFNKHTIGQVENDLSQAGFKNITYEKVQKEGFDSFYICALKQSS